MHVTKGMVGCLGVMKMYVKSNPKELHVVVTV